MKKRFWAVFLALALCAGLLPASAQAADTEPTLTGEEMVALLPSERPEVIPPDSVSLPWNEEDEERTFREIVELTRSLTAGKTTETEKARAVFEWVAKNIEYDHTAFEYWLMQRRGDRLTEEQDTRLTQSGGLGYAFYNRRAICSGYANLANFMLRLAGLPSAYIAGEASNLPHAWSAACTDGRWIIFDATWNLWDMAPDDRQIVEEITWPDGIWRMGIYSTGQVSCFLQKQYRDVSSVTIPDSVNTLDDSAFADCTKLTSVTIPSNVIYLKNGVFKGCTALTSVDIPNSVTGMGTWTFWDCTALTNVTIPDSVTKIGQYTFNGCTALAHVDIPNSVTEIETNAFKNCTALTEVTIPGSVTKMGSGVFEKCTALTRAVFGGGLTSISSSTFWGCDSLTSVAIPDSVTSIGSTAFYNCPNLTDVYYSGSEEQWDAIEIGTFSSFLKRNSGSTRCPIFHYNTVGGFGDVNTGDYFAEPVLWAVEQGITAGTSETTFSPDNPCTTAHILAFLWRDAGRPGGSGSMTWEQEQAAVASWAGTKGIAAPDLNTVCTRAAAVTYMWKAAGSPEPQKAASFADVPASADYAKAVSWAVERGITAGTSETTFSPGQGCTRGQIVSFLYRALPR